MNNEFQMMGLGKPGIHERRGGRDDFMVRVLRVAGLLTYPLLFINVVIFYMVTGMDRGAELEFVPSTMERISSWVYLNTFMPVMATGLIIGIVGIILSTRRSRRSSDLNFKYPMLFTILSVIGLLVYFWFRKG